MMIVFFFTRITHASHLILTHFSKSQKQFMEYSDS